MILAGGLGTRLHGMVNDIPKPMAPVAGKPFLEYIVSQLAKWGVEKIILSVGYKREAIEAYFEDGRKFGAHISYLREEYPLGTGGAFRKACGMVKEDNFIGMNGDSFFDIDLKRLIETHNDRKAAATVGLLRGEDGGRFGSAEMGENGLIVNFGEKTMRGNGLINGGVYVFSRKIADHIPEGKISLEKEVFPKLAGKNLYGFVNEGFFADMGTPESYLGLLKEPGRLKVTKCA